MRIAIVIFLFFVLTTQQLISHGQQTHQSVVREAYNLLKYQKSQMYFSTIVDYVGYMETGTGPWQTGKIVTGAYREDEEDVIYRYNGLGGVYKCLTHFWNPGEPTSGDGGAYTGDDDQKWLYMASYWENAFTKAKAFYYGDHYIYIEMDGPTIWGERWVYDSLPDLWETGSYTALGYYNVLGQYTQYSPPQQRTLSATDRKEYASEILGRIAHLLADMGVPAHCHNDPHPPTIDPNTPGAGDDTDIYEDFMKNTIYWMSAKDVWDVGGTLEDVTTKNYPLRYLFYVLNQISDYYPSGNVASTPDKSGDKNYYSSYTKNNLTDSYSLLTSFYNSLPASPNQINEFDQREKIYPHTIKMVASLLHLFADETDEIPTISINQTSSGTLTANEIWQNNFTLTGDVTIPIGKTLVVAPGANIRIPAGKKIIVQGTLIARDCDDSSITFDRSGSSNWYGIKFESTSDDSECILENCAIKHCSYAVYCNQAAPAIKNCEISYSMVGLYGYYYDSLDPVEGNLFKLNSLYGALLAHPETIVMFNNELYNYGTNIKCYYSDYATTLRDNDIYQSGASAQGILFDHSSPIVIENMIYNNNRYGVNCINGSTPEFIHEDVDGTNNVIADNASYGVITDATSLPKLSDLSVANTAYNSIYSNRGSYDIYNGNATSISARGNWWGQNPPNTARFYGGIDYTNPLSEDPNPTAPSLSKGDVEAIPSASTNDEVNKEARDKFDIGYKFEIEGALQKAINEYDIVVDKYPATIEAKMALVHIGICYDKLGSRESKNSTFSNVASEKSDYEVGGLANLLNAQEDSKNMRFEDALAKYKDVAQKFPQTVLAQHALYDEWGIQFNVNQDESAARKIIDEYEKQFGADEMLLSMQAAMGELTEEMLKRSQQPILDSIQGIPKQFALHPNYPNPFNPQTHIAFDLPQAGMVRLEIFNVLGQRTLVLLDEEKPAGHHNVQWETQTATGTKASAGIYFCRMTAGSFSKTIKMTVLP